MCLKNPPVVLAGAIDVERARRLSLFLALQKGCDFAFEVSNGKIGFYKV